VLWLDVLLPSCVRAAPRQAESAIVEGRGAHYTVPASLASHFTADELADLKVHFGMFDADGGGSIAAEELKGVLDDMGMHPTEEQVVMSQPNP
jgi:Ca2+-binding EF-hand superfamily protein